jgi:adenosylmethionine-8-amino-7-oxononanoate aminotransferase
VGIEERIRRLIEQDREFLWHPFTQMKEWAEEEPVIIAEGRDCFIRDIRGRWYLDGVSSIWVNIHGHRKRELDDAIRGQLDSIAHTTLLGLSNVPAIELAERLAGLMRSAFGEGGPSRVFYTDNGSTAVEAALKMAFQYWLHKGVKGRSRFISLRHGYHGDTLGAVSVGGVDIFHKTFEPLLFKTHQAASPYCYRCEFGEHAEDCGIYCLKDLDDILKEHAEETAALILEPLIQCAGGMIVFPPGYLSGVKSLCRRYGVLLIADEVATGFGRTGKMFACEHEEVVPDIICLSKGITGGYLPLAATIATEEIYRAFLGEFGELKTFFHGHSYTGNPLAAACALACLDVFEKEETLRHLEPKIADLKAWLGRISAHPHVGEARNVGLMARVELVRDKETREPYRWEEKMGWRAARAAMEDGVFIRPLGNVLVIMPPLAIGRENLERMCSVLEEAIERATEEG